MKNTKDRKFCWEIFGKREISKMNIGIHFEKIGRLFAEILRSVQKSVNLVDFVKSFHTITYYLLAKIGFDTDESEPLKVWG